MKFPKKWNELNQKPVQIEPIRFGQYRFFGVETGKSNHIGQHKKKVKKKKICEQIIYYTLARSLLEYAKANLSNKKIIQLVQDYPWWW